MQGPARDPTKELTVPHTSTTPLPLPDLRSAVRGRVIAPR